MSGNDENNWMDESMCILWTWAIPTILRFNLFHSYTLYTSKSITWKQHHRVYDPFYSSSFPVPQTMDKQKQIVMVIPSPQSSTPRSPLRMWVGGWKTQTSDHFHKPRERIWTRDGIVLRKKWNIYLVGGFNPSEKSSQLGFLCPMYGKIKNVPNHQPVIYYIHIHSM
jgi:hypothetical protein